MWPVGRSAGTSSSRSVGSLLDSGRKGERGVKNDSKAMWLGNLGAKSGHQNTVGNLKWYRPGAGGEAGSVDGTCLWLRVGAVSVKVCVRESGRG